MSGLIGSSSFELIDLFGLGVQVFDRLFDSGLDALDDVAWKVFSLPGVLYGSVIEGILLADHSFV
jgi:hypothetical protein